MIRTRLFSLLAVTVFLSVLTAILLPVLSASAAETGDNAPFAPHPRALTALLDTVEDDFNRATVDWEIKNGSAEAVNSLGSSPYSVFEGSRSLRLSTDGNASVTANRIPASLTVIDGISALVAAVYAPAEAEETSVTLTLECDTGRYTETKPLTAGRWQAVFFSLSEEALSGTVGSFSFVFSAKERGEHVFLLDTFGGTFDPSAARTARYLTDTFLPDGCSLAENGDGLLTVSLSGNRQSLTAENPILTDFSGGTGIRLRLRNRSTCKSVTLQYTTLGSDTYSEANSLTAAIPEGDGTVSCLFPIPDAYIGSFRLVFDGVSYGEIDILSVSAVPCYTSPSASVGQIRECLIGKNKTSFTVKGSFTSAEAETYAGSSLYLYELLPFESHSSISTARTPIATSYLNGGEFSFTLPLSAERTELIRKYAVMIYRDGALLPVGSPAFLTNPEALASQSVGDALDTVKGGWPLSDDFLFENASCTAVEIRLDRLVSFGQNGIAGRAGEDSVLFDLAYLVELDKQMKNYDACGIEVIFLLRLKRPEDLSLRALLCHPDAEGGCYAAFNTVTAEGIEALRSVSHLLTTRYGTPDGVTDNLLGFTVGSSVNDAAVHYHMGSATLAQLAETYGNALRVVYNTARSVISDVEVYLPLGGDWYRGDPVGQRSSFDAYSMLEAVSAAIKAGGDIDWKLSYDIHTDHDTYAWENGSPDLSEEARRVDASNMEVLTETLSRNRFLYHGISRTVLILETEPWDTEDENERIRLSADYVYTYLRLSSRAFSSVKAYIPAHPVDYNGVFAYIDTNRFAEATDFAAEIMGQPLFDSLTAGASSLSTRYLSEVDAVPVIPSAVKGESVLFDFSSETAGWFPSLHCADLKAGVSLDGRDDLISARFEKADPLLWRGIAVSLATPVDLSHAPYLGFVCRPAVLPENVNELELAVVIEAGRNRLIATIHVKAGADNTVVVDLSTFPHADACDGFAVYVRGIDGVDIGEPTLLMSSMCAMSEQYAGEELDRVIHPEREEQPLPTVSLRTVIPVALVGAAALVFEIVRIGLRRSRKNEIEE